MQDFRHENYGIIRGIQHSNRLTDIECQPETMLVSGGINEQTATVRITQKLNILFTVK